MGQGRRYVGRLMTAVIGRATVGARAMQGGRARHCAACLRAQWPEAEARAVARWESAQRTSEVRVRFTRSPAFTAHL